MATQRITKNELETLAKRINRAAGENVEAVSRDDDGEFHWNIGTYFIDSAYGGVKLQRVTSDGGGVTSISSGYVTKRELYKFMHAFLSGLEAKKGT